jgi:hypothetical protein
MINKHEHASVGVYWNDIGVLDWKVSGWLNNSECLTAGETEDLVKKEVIFRCFAFCVPLYTSLCGDMTACNSCLNFKNLAVKWSAPNDWLSNLPSLGLSLRHLIYWVLSSCSRPSSVNSAVWELRTSWISAFKPGNPFLGTLQANGGDIAYFVLLVGESPEVINSFRPKFFPSAIQSFCPATPLCLLCI